MTADVSGRVAEQLSDIGVQPAVSEESRRWWSAGGRGKLVVEQCDNCGQHVFPLRGICRRCWGRSLHQVEVTSPGRLHAWTINHHAWGSGPSAYILGLVEFPQVDHLRFVGPVEDVDPAQPDLTVGQPMGFFFHPAASLGGLPRLYFTARIDT